jgi:hypothetical protein
MGYTSNRTLDLYINGKLVGSGTATQSLYGWKSSNVIMIGGRAQFRAGVDGTVDEVRLYNKTLTASEVKASMQHHSGNITDQNFIGYWDFEGEPDLTNNVMFSTGANKNIYAGLYDPATEVDSEYKREEITFAAGAPFISGTNYKIETLPKWTLKGASVLSATGDKSSGAAQAVYSNDGDYKAELTLTNGWGSDTKTVAIVAATGIEDVTVEEMQAFPNPFENEVFVSFVESGDYTAEIYDYSGRLINAMSVSAVAGEAYEIPVEGVSGIYFIKVKGEAGLLKVMKVIKK